MFDLPKLAIRMLSPVVLAFSTAARAVPPDGPYAIIATDMTRSADPTLRPLLVSRVDNVYSKFGKAVVAPGMHAVTVDLHSGIRFHEETQATFELEARPCTRYVVAARLDHSLARGWVPVVSSEERLGDCASKFNLP